MGHGKRKGVIYNPSTGKKVKEVAFANAEDIEIAVAIAKSAQTKWAAVTPLRRVRTSPSGAARRNHQAITAGLAGSGRIIAGAASIMILVFGSFLLGGHRILQEFGFALGFSVLIDALVIRGLLVPALMHLLGPANWTVPAWLDRLLPRLAVEAGYRKG